MPLSPAPLPPPLPLLLLPPPLLAVPPLLPLPLPPLLPLPPPLLPVVASLPLRFPLPSTPASSEGTSEVAPEQCTSASASAATISANLTIPSLAFLSMSSPSKRTVLRETLKAT